MGIIDEPLSLIQYFCVKMKKIVYCFLLILFSGCSNEKPKQPGMLPEEEIPAFREAAIKMTEYIELKDSAFHLTISKKSAVEQGIPEKYYNRMQQELEFTNYTIKEYNRKGMPISIDEYWIE